MKFHTRLAACAVILGAMTNANGGAVVGATEFTQLANNFQLLASYGEQVQQTVHQINMYQKMLQNLKQSVPSVLLDQQAQNLWKNQNMMQTFRNLRTIVKNGEQMTYSLATQAQMFKRLHPGFSAPFNAKDSYRDWSDDTHAAVSNALAVSGVQADSIDSEQDMIQELQSRSQSADGQLMMMKAGNDIGVAMVGQMQQLRQLQIAQMTAQNHFMKSQTSMQDSAKQGAGIFLGNLRSSKVVKGTRTVPSEASE